MISRDIVMFTYKMFANLLNVFTNDAAGEERGKGGRSNNMMMQDE